MTRIPFTFFVALASLLSFYQTALAQNSIDKKELLEGVNEIGFPGAPGMLSVFGKDAVAIVTCKKGDNRAPFIACAALDKGRLAAVPHDGYFGKEMEKGDTIRLIQNLLKWTAGIPAREKTIHIGLRRQNYLKNEFQKVKQAYVDLDGRDWTQKLSQCDTIIVGTHNLSDAEVTALLRYVRNGGGIIAAGLGWAWQGYSAKPGQTLAEDFPGNRIFSKAGICWTSGTADKPTGGLLKVDANESVTTNALDAIKILQRAAVSKGKSKLVELDNVEFILGEATRIVPQADQILRPELNRLLVENAGNIPVPSKRQPVRTADAAGRVLVTLQTKQALQADVDNVKSHPASAVFPGEVPSSAKRVSRKFTIDTAIPRWHSLGLYAAPGEIISVKTDKQNTGQKLEVRIGAHQDKLWHKTAWRRIPEITKTFPIASTETKAANPFGGLVYIVVPKNCQLGKIDVSVSNAVESPLFMHGKTDLDEWRLNLRQQPAPWAELASSKFIITLPSDAVRQLDFPDKLMDYWDEVLDACADLGTTPRNRPYAERFVIDEQISAGYLHAGYPIMAPMNFAQVSTDLAKLRQLGDWGMYHELGHNHQVRDWTYDGMGEVTVNLFSLYCLDKLNPGAPVHGAITDEAIKKHIAKFEQTGVRDGPFMNLVPYVQLQEEFGWEAYKKVFEEYRKLSPGERAKNDLERRNQWLTRFSRNVNRDLSPFFEYWKIVTSPEARKSLGDLKPWIPESLEK